ncbi:MAG: alpha/beta fold hydrolase [Deltaproteobacteria bacterium]|nr:alpha/beta fold hydrolase [Deltaproteobacteria bacterium]
MGTVVLLLICAPLIIAGLMVAITFPLAWWVFPSAGRREDKGDDDTLAGRLAGGAFTLAVEWAASVWVILSVLFRFVMRPLFPPAGLRPTVVPVLLLPGYLENALTMHWLARKLERRLQAPVQALSPAEYLVSLERMAEDYQAQILDYLEAAGVKQVDLVGHSMGGLLARLLLEQTELRGRIRSVITLGTPHLGTAVARLAFGRNMRQMRRGSAFLEQLNARIRQTDVHFVGICSVHDSYVLPWRCALAPFGENHVLRYCGHLTLLVSGRVAQIVARELGRE